MPRPMHPQVVRKVVDGHPVDTRTALVRLDTSQRLLQVLSLTCCLHQRGGDHRAFGLALRHDRFGTLTDGGRRYSVVHRGKGQLKLFGQPRSGHESGVLGASPFIPVWGPFGLQWGETIRHLPARFHHLLCPLLTSAPRSGALAGPSVRLGHDADLPG